LCELGIEVREEVGGGGGVENLTKQRSGSGFSSRKRRASAITIANGPENEKMI